MRTYKSLLVFLISIAFISACGGGEYKLKVEWDDDSEDEEVLTSQEETSEPSSQEEGWGSENENDGEDGSAETTCFEDCDSTEGGIEHLEVGNGYKKNRYFMGTYQFVDYIYWYGGSYNGECKYGFPLNVRLYSHDNVIDFERSSGKLVWIADIYEDETFDFVVGFLNRFGNPSMELFCTCFIDDDYWYYSDDMIKCGCEPSNGDDNCEVYYEKLDN